MSRVDDVTPAVLTSRPRVEVVGGTLTLGPAAPDPFGYIPSGALVPVSCLLQYGDSVAVINAINHTIVLKNGTVYPIPPCGDAPYTLTLRLRYLGRHTGATDATTTTTGLHAWGPLGTEDTVIKLMAAGAIGTVTTPQATAHLSIQRGRSLGGLQAAGPHLELDKE